MFYFIWNSLFRGPYRHRRRWGKFHSHQAPPRMGRGDGHLFDLLPGGKEPAWRCRWVTQGINKADKSTLCPFYMALQTPTSSGSCIKYTFWSMCPDRVHGTQSSLLQWAVNALRIGVPRASCQGPSTLQEKLMNKAGCFGYRQTVLHGN